MRSKPFDAQSLALVFLAFLLVGCNGGIFGVRGSGNVVSETRDVAGFTEIDLQTSGSVEVEVTGTDSLTIGAEDNIQPLLTAVVENGTLVLGSDGNFTSTKGVDYAITVASLEGLSISGSGAIEGSEIAGDRLTVEISGSGAIHLRGVDTSHVDGSIAGSGEIALSGTTGDLALSIGGSGAFRGDAMVADTANVSIGGSGSALVNVTESLIADVSGSGSVEYLGDPEVTSNITGSGSVNPG